MKKNNDKTPTKNEEDKVFDNMRIQWAIRTSTNTIQVTSK